MKAIIVYPIPFDDWQTFQPFVERFASTFKEFPPGISNYELWAVPNWGEPTPEIKSLFYGIKTVWLPYNGHGCDIGSAQLVAQHCEYPDTFVLAMTSRCYFHRRDWLLRFVEARQKRGPGLYGAFASWESGTPHICTRAYGMTAGEWNDYPHVIDTREKGQQFEVGEWCVSRWMSQRNGKLVQVLWDEENEIGNWRKPQGIFRSDRQQCCLVWDKHTDAYAEADDEEKKRLESLSEIPSWSQCGEDRWILENLRLPVRGTFVEVGAYDGVQSSNTLLFERMGWDGLCIEADPDLVLKCQANRKAMTVRFAVTCKTGDTVFYVNPDDRGLSGLTRPGNPIRVTGRRLDAILNSGGIDSVDVLSIDTEGTELDVWNSRGRISARVVIMEHKTCDLPSQAEAIASRMRTDGYRLIHQTTHNQIFALPEILEGSKAGT